MTVIMEDAEMRSQFAILAVSAELLDTELRSTASPTPHRLNN